MIYIFFRDRYICLCYIGPLYSDLFIVLLCENRVKESMNIFQISGRHRLLPPWQIEPLSYSLPTRDLLYNEFLL